MKKYTFSLPIVLRDLSARNWDHLSLLAFIVSYLGELVVSSPEFPPEALRPIYGEFRRYGAELEILEDDLRQCLNEFSMAVEMYSEPESLPIKKFALVYHTDNYNVRVHKLVANLFVLLAYTCKVGRRTPEDPEGPFRSLVIRNLRECGLGGVAQRVRAFQGSKYIMPAVDDRNRFVHSYRVEPEWPSLRPTERYDDTEDELAVKIRQIDQTTDLDRYAKRKVGELTKALEAIRTFRDDLFQLFLKRYDDLTAHVKSKQKGENRRRRAPAG